MKPERLKPRLTLIDDLDPTERYLAALDTAAYRGPNTSGGTAYTAGPNYGDHPSPPTVRDGAGKIIGVWVASCDLLHRLGLSR